MSKKEIIKFIDEEYELNSSQIESIPNLTKPNQNKIDNLIKPAIKIDKKLSELTVSINQKMYEIDVKSDEIINCGCANTVGIGTSIVIALGTTSFYQRVQAPRNDSEDLSYTGDNPFSDSNLGTSNLTSGIGSNTVTVPSNFGVGVETQIITLSGVDNSIFTVDANPSGVSTCPGKTCSELSSQLDTLESELTSLISERNSVLSIGVNTLKEELKFQYTIRHSYNAAKKKIQDRNTKLKTIENLAKDSRYDAYFDP